MGASTDISIRYRSTGCAHLKTGCSAPCGPRTAIFSRTSAKRAISATRPPQSSRARLMLTRKHLPDAKPQGHAGPYRHHQGDAEDHQGHADDAGLEAAPAP